LMISKVIKEYERRNFEHLSIYFGCTGGQHRSVFCTEKLAFLLKQNFDIDMVVEHLNEFVKHK